jgi:hypothetical protein
MLIITACRKFLLTIGAEVNLSDNLIMIAAPPLGDTIRMK